MWINLYMVLVVSTMIYGCSTWFLTNRIKHKLNGVNSKLVAQITKRSIHEEAKSPSVNVIQLIEDRRSNFLGHILRLNEDKSIL